MLRDDILQLHPLQVVPDLLIRVQLGGIGWQLLQMDFLASWAGQEAFNLHDKEGAKLLLAPLAGQLPRMAQVWADSAYPGLQKGLKETLGWDLEVVKH
jgi:hypothetical protein